MVVTRWDTDYKMLERAVEQKKAINSELCEAGEDSLSANEWKLAEGYVSVLSSIAKHTAELGSDRMPTHSMVLPVLFEIDSDLEAYIKTAKNGRGITFARKLKENLKKRFPFIKYQDNETYVLSMLLDPRYKDILVEEDWFVEPTRLLQQKAEEKLEQHIQRGIPITAQINMENHEEESQVSQPSASTGWGHLEKKKKKQSKSDVNSKTRSDAIKKEVETYLAVDPISCNADPLEWWRINKDSYPYLAPVARHYLALAATETSSERLFSVGGNTVSDTRTHLLPDHVKEIVFLHDNIKL